MVDTIALTKTVCQVVVAATGLPANKVIIGDPGTSAPSGTYAAVRIDSPAQFGQALKAQRNVPATDDPRFEDIIERVATQFTIGFSINIYRAGAMGHAMSLCEANKREPIKSVLRKAKLGWSRVSPINNLTGLYQAAMEERSQVTLYLYGESIAEDRINRIYRVGFEVQTEQSGAIAQGEVNALSG
ncbi:LIC_12616 family protein [Pseudomonas sp. NY11955]|uniref:phage neck terminator protein n=1 Tax=Pseudomonas sp. NY11955 TaxID=3400363 RepID=UPI003A86771D